MAQSGTAPISREVARRFLPIDRGAEAIRQAAS
jgi:hypothetical protein